MEILMRVEVKAPIEAGQVIVRNILNTEIDIIASRSLYSISGHDGFTKEYMVQG
jgi:CxxC motif-containing protein